MVSDVQLEQPVGQARQYSASGGLYSSASQQVWPIFTSGEMQVSQMFLLVTQVAQGASHEQLPVGLPVKTFPGAHEVQPSVVLELQDLQLEEQADAQAGVP